MLDSQSKNKRPRQRKEGSQQERQQKQGKQSGRPSKIEDGIAADKYVSVLHFPPG